VNENLRDRIVRKLETLSDERGYQVLDYVEFLESRFAERQNPQANAFTRFTEGIEDKLRAGKVSASAIAETMSLLNRAGNVLSGVAAAGKSVANDIVQAAQAPPPAPRPSGSTGSGGTTGATGTAKPAGDSAPPADKSQPPK
jgi:hypothetical protein